LCETDVFYKKQLSLQPEIEAPRGLPRGISDSKKESCVLLANPAASSGECARGIQKKHVSWMAFIQTGLVLFIGKLTK